MNKIKYNKISKKDFLKLNEDNLIFVTNPGRMGDEDGSTFVIKNGNELTIYRVDGWMYPSKNIKEEYVISMNDMTLQFPKWFEMWKHSDEKDYNEKYQYLYMGFGNGLSIDNTIYDEYKPYLDKKIENDLKEKSKEEKKSLKYATIFCVWENALMKMAKDKGYIVK